jgi:methyl-accepting chemotaxis protein
MNPRLLAAGLAVDRETNAAVGDVAAGTDRMAKNAALMTDSALLLGKNSSSVAAAAEEALTNAQTVAKASSQLSASIAEIASQANSSRKLTLEAVTVSTHALALPRVAFRPKPWLRRVAALRHIVDRGVCKRNNLT